MIDFTITLHASLADSEIEELAASASEFGISDTVFSESGRIIVAETEREDEAILWIVEWLAHGLYETEIIGQIKEERIYWPVFEGDEDYEAYNFFAPSNE